MPRRRIGLTSSFGLGRRDFHDGGYAEYEFHQKGSDFIEIHKDLDAWSCQFDVQSVYPFSLFLISKGPI